MDAILENLGPKKLALLSKRIFNRIAANSPHSSDDERSPLFSECEREKLVSSFGVSSLDEVDSLVNEVELFWKNLRLDCENIADRIRSLELSDATRSTAVQIWDELGKAILFRKPAEARTSVVVQGNVCDLLDVVDYSVGVVVASKENNDSLPKPVMQMELSTSAGPVNVELDFEQLAAIHAALRDAQAHFDSS